jgi:hypothetical protein
MKPIDNHWHYHSEVPPPKKRRRELLAAKSLYFQVSYETRTIVPNHQVTLRTSVAGWSRDIIGGYWFGAWRFYLPRAHYKGDWKFKFLLDAMHWQAGPDLAGQGDQSQNLTDTEVRFAEVPNRFVHGYDNLRVEEDVQQQNLLRSNCPEPDDGVWDVIIIGTGMGGGVLADALTDFPKKTFKVLALDAGSLDYQSHLDNLPTGAIGRLLAEKDDQINETAEVRNYDAAKGSEFGSFIPMNLGGRSVYWSGLIPRMGDWELAFWPQSIKKYLQTSGYDDAEQLMRKHVTAGRFQEKVIADLKKNFQKNWEIVDTPRSWHQPDFGPASDPEKHPESFRFCSTGAFSTAELLIDSLRAVGNPKDSRLHIKLNHLATELQTAGDTVTGVVCEDLIANERRIFKGKFIVLAAGSLESARLALKSGLKDPIGKIGVGLTDHPSFYAPNHDEGFPIGPNSPYFGWDKHARIFFYPKQQWDGHWFNVEIVINDQYWRVRHADDDVLNRAFGPNGPSRVKFKFIFGSELQESNYVRLNAAGVGPLDLKHDWNGTSVAAKNAVFSLLQNLCKFFDTTPPAMDDDNSFHYGAGGTPHHAGGTLRMAVNGRPGLVDEDLKFLEYRNLYACDPSVFPYIPAANPSLTLSALALRLAKDLAGRLP